MPKNKLNSYLLLHFIVFIWGFTAILGKLISINAIALVWYRMLLGAFFILIYFLLKKKSLKIDKKGALKFFVTGSIIAIHWVTFFQAIKVSNVSVTAATMSTGAFFVSFIEPFFFKRKIKLIEIVMGLMVVFGLSIIFNFQSQYTMGIIYGLISAFLSALFVVLNGLHIKNYNHSIISFYQLLFGAIGVSFFMGLTKKVTVDLFQLTLQDWLYLLVLSSICTAFAFISSVKIMKHLSPYTVMLTTNFEPIYSIILAVIIFGEKEQMNIEFYYGASVILFVVVLNGIVKNKIKKFKYKKLKT